MQPEELGRWLDADAIVYGEILDYEAYWAGLISVWRVSARVKMISTFDGHEVFRAQSHRYSVDVAPAVDPIDICINSAMTAIDLRDIRLARTESEVGREIVMRLPMAQRNIANLQKEAVEKERSVIVESDASGNSGPVAQPNIESARDENTLGRRPGYPGYASPDFNPELRR